MTTLAFVNYRAVLCISAEIEPEKDASHPSSASAGGFGPGPGRLPTAWSACPARPLTCERCPVEKWGHPVCGVSLGRALRQLGSGVSPALQAAAPPHGVRMGEGPAAAGAAGVVAYASCKPPQPRSLVFPAHCVPASCPPCAE